MMWFCNLLAFTGILASHASGGRQSESLADLQQLGHLSAKRAVLSPSPRSRTQEQSRPELCARSPA